MLKVKQTIIDYYRWHLLLSRFLHSMNKLKEIVPHIIIPSINFFWQDLVIRLDSWVTVIIIKHDRERMRIDFAQLITVNMEAITIPGPFGCVYAHGWSNRRDPLVVLCISRLLITHKEDLLYCRHVVRRRQSTALCVFHWPDLLVRYTVVYPMLPGRVKLRHGKLCSPFVTSKSSESILACALKHVRTELKI